MKQDVSNRNISITGLGYVGLPLALCFGKNQKVIGYDKNPDRIEELKNNHDRTKEFTAKEISDSFVHYTNDPLDLKKANFHIIAVPTPIDSNKQPDLRLLEDATETVGKHLKKNDIVVIESTVYPSVTEEFCLPILEKYSSLKSGIDFKIGYSPERINPGDKERSLTKIVKIVSGQDTETLEIISQVYGSIIEAGIYRANSIKVAEAAKIIENVQRDINIALINELAIIFQRMQIDTKEVLQAASTKWNFQAFTPGLVGGHCIGVDPYYLTHQAQRLGYHPEMILAGRKINDNMGKFIAQQTILQMIHQNISIKGAKVLVMGFTFKENCADVRNTRVIDIIHELRDYGIEIYIHDPIAHADEVKKSYGLELIEWQKLPQTNAIVLAVPHKKYIELNTEDYAKKLLENGVIIDVKSCLDAPDFKENGIKIWRL